MDFLRANIPTPGEVLTLGPLCLLWAGICLGLAAYARQRGWKTGYSRKLFHFLIFFSVATIQAWWGLRAVCLFGGMVSLLLLYVLWRGDGHPMYEALARERDAPHRTWYIVAPYFATLIGGIIANVFWPETAIAGYLVAGIGDAIAEPVGVRFGKHRYRVPAIRGVSAERSYEGSAAVFGGSVLALSIAMFASAPSAQLLGVVALVAIAATLAEAVSPHGWDNATMQVLPAGLCAILV